MRNWGLWLAAGIISLLGGIFALANPLAATLTATLLAAWAFIVVGILTIASAFADQGWGGRIAAILLGILMVLLGVNLAGDPLAGTLSLTMATAILLVVLVLTVALRSLKGRLRMNGLALLGLAVLCGFVLVRAVGFHHVDQLISMDFARLPFNFWFENAGLFLIAVNALWLAGRDSAPRPAAVRPFQR